MQKNIWRTLTSEAEGLAGRALTVWPEQLFSNNNINENENTLNYSLLFWQEFLKTTFLFEKKKSKVFKILEHLPYNIHGWTWFSCSHYSFYSEQAAQKSSALSLEHLCWSTLVYSIFRGGVVRTVTWPVPKQDGGTLPAWDIFSVFRLILIIIHIWKNKLILKKRLNTHVFCYLRNRSAPAVNCWVIIHCLEVSCKEDQITSA